MLVDLPGVLKPKLFIPYLVETMKTFESVIAYENEDWDLNFDLRKEGYLGQQSGQEEKVYHEGDQNVVDLLTNIFKSRFLIVNEVIFIVLFGFKLWHNDVVAASVYSKVGICI